MSAERPIGAWKFAKVGGVEVDRNSNGEVVGHLPQERFDNVQSLPLHKYGTGPFCKFRMNGIPSVPGVYAYVVDGDVRYIGESHFAPQTLYAYRNISPRMCFRGGQERSCRINNLIFQAASDGSAIELWFHATPDHKNVEAHLRSELRPLWNRI